MRGDLAVRLDRLAGAVADRPPTARLCMIAWGELTRVERDWVLRRLGAASNEGPEDADLRNLSDEELARELAEARCRLQELTREDES